MEGERERPKLVKDINHRFNESWQPKQDKYTNKHLDTSNKTAENHRQRENLKNSKKTGCLQRNKTIADFSIENKNQKTKYIQNTERK